MDIPEKVEVDYIRSFIEPTCAYARWALKSRFLSVWLHYTKIHWKKIISLEVNKYNMLTIVKLTRRWAHNNVKFFLLHAHDGACLTNGGTIIQDQQMGTMQSFSSLTHQLFIRLQTHVQVVLSMLIS